MNLSLLKNFLNAQIAQGEEARPPDGLPPFSCRFPPALWQVPVLLRQSLGVLRVQGFGGCCAFWEF
ncbi:unnamed protein product [Symbiodinium sp. CCMP2592]|nr:unnamed protein product [Symbiodinium sp. CCMP2592]